MPDALMPASFLFRYSVPCLYRDQPWSDVGAPLALDESYRLPSFASLDGGPEGPQMRTAWNEAGLTFSLRVAGKRQTPWCRENRVDESDGLHIWIDTRDTHNIHRAGRFCHYFVFLPIGGGRGDEPIAAQLLINRARENARPVGPRALRVRGQKQPDGYLLDAFIPADALTGFDPIEHPRLGFMYAVIDREIGVHTFACPPEFPFRDDPSVWVTLELK